MERFDERPGASKPTYDYAMPQNAEIYGDSHVADPDGTVHRQLTHSKVRMWRADDPGTKCAVSIVDGNGTELIALTVGPGAAEWVVPHDGLVSVVSTDGVPLAVYADVFPVWAG